MRVGVGQLSLGRRIVASVALGLGLILSLFGLVALWTITESTETAYQERVAFAEVLATRVDDVLRYSRVTLQREAANLRIDPGRPPTKEQHQWLNDLSQRVGGFAILSVVDVDGTNAWTEPSSAEAVIGNPLHHPSVQLVLRTNRPHTVEFRSRADASKVFACLAVPVHDSAGQIVGVLMAELDADDPALNLLPTREIDNAMHAQLLVGNVASDSNPKYVAEHRALLADLIEARGAGYRIHGPGPESPFPSHVVAYAPVSELPSWGITVEQPRDVVLATPRRLQQRLALFGLAALLLAAAVAWLDVRRVIWPLKDLTAIAERFAAGQIDQPVRLNRADELGVLARAFETMRLQLRASLAEVAEWNRSALLEPDRVIDLVVRKGRDLFGSEIAGLGLVEEGSGELTWRLLAGGADHFRQVRSRPGEGIAGHVVETGRPLAIADCEGLPSECSAPAPVLPVAGLRAALAVPLQSRGQTFGVLMVGNCAPTTFGDDQVALLARLADQAAVALENARLYQKVQSLAALEERERIAREMHDGLGQVLGYVNTKTLAVARLLDVGKVDEARAQVSQLEAVAKEVYADVREAILGLRTTLGPEHDFLTALREYLDGFEQQSGIAVELETPAAEDKLGLPFAAEIQLLRIAQEALVNVRKHAQARRATVRLAPVDGVLRLVIDDDGKGFDPVRQTPEGWPRFGLQTMRERAKAIGGTLEVESRAGAGTRITIEVPQDHPEEVFDAADKGDQGLAGR